MTNVAILIQCSVAGLALAVALMLAGCCSPVRADEPFPLPGAESDDDAARQARDLADEVLRKAGNGNLGEWTRSIVERALQRAGETARQTAPGSPGETAAPLPAERHAGALAGARRPTAEILVFTSLSVPAASWRQWADDAARFGAPLVLRGVGEDGLRATVKRIGDRIGAHKAGVAIDPRLFRLFGVTRVPAVVVAPGGVPPCVSRGCAEDAPPPFDVVTGNIGLVAALEAIAAEGDAGRHVARAQLERLNGGER